MTLSVEELMLKEDQIPLARPDDRVADILDELTNKKCGALLVADHKGELLGIFTDGDLRRALQREGSDVLNRPLRSMMTPSVIQIQRGKLAWEALKIMQKDPKKFVMVLPVVEEGKVAGILRMHDIIQAGIS